MTTVDRGGQPKRVPLHPYRGDGRHLVAMYNLGGRNLTARAIAAEIENITKTLVIPNLLGMPLRRLRGRGLIVSVHPGGRDQTLLHSLTAAGAMAAVHESPDTAEWKRRHDKGDTVRAIAKSVGHTECSVSEALRSLGAHTSQYRRSGAQVRIKRKPEWATRYLIDRWSIRRLAESEGISYGGMRGALKRLGVELRDRGGRS